MPADPTSPPTPAAPVLAVRAAEACRILGIGRRLLWSLTVAKDIPHCRIARCVTYPIDGLREWLRERQEGGARHE